MNTDNHKSGTSRAGKFWNELLGEESNFNDSPLGRPLDIGEAAKLIGCSPWTIRQRHIPNGLPCFRSGASGKLIFYRDQVIRWILERQMKGGPRL